MFRDGRIIRLHRITYMNLMLDKSRHMGYRSHTAVDHFLKKAKKSQDAAVLQLPDS